MRKINWKYAIGEILIVMVGITLAFGLNNLKSHFDHQDAKQKYLSALQNDLKDEALHLKELDSLIRLKVDYIRVLRPHFGSGKAGRDSLLTKFFFVAQNVSFIRHDATYNMLVNSADLNLIENFELRKEIEAHYAHHKLIEKSYERLDNIYADYLGHFFIHKLDYNKIYQGDLGFLDEQIIANIYNALEGAYHIALESNLTCANSNDRLQTAIDRFQKD